MRASLPRRHFLGRILTLPALAATFGLLTASPVAAQPANPRVEMVIEKRGTIVVEMLPKAAPKTVAHLTALINKKFYDGMLIHRHQDKFVVQTGDPKSKKVNPKTAKIEGGQYGSMIQGLGDGGSGQTVPLEVDASAVHSRGTLGMARSNDPNSGDSQFFFNLQNNNQLDGGYTVFAKVVKGMDVMDKLRVGDRIKSMRVIKATKK